MCGPIARGSGVNETALMAKVNEREHLCTVNTCLIFHCNANVSIAVI